MRRLLTGFLSASLLFGAAEAAAQGRSGGPAEATTARAMAGPAAATLAPDPRAVAIADRLSVGDGALRLSGEETAGLGVVTLDRTALRRLYEPRGYAPLWLGEEARAPAETPPASVTGVVTVPDGLANIRAVADALNGSDRHGLSPATYHAAVIAELLRVPAPRPPEAEVALELLTSAAVMDLADHLATGRIDPSDIDAEIDYPDRAFDRQAAAARIALSTDPGARLMGHAPGHVPYAGLPDLLDRLDAVERAGGWPRVPDGATLREGDRDPAVAALRARLRATGELPPRASEPPLDGLREVETRYDAALAGAVERFQSRHGLAVDGIVGRNTRAALNVPAAERRRQVVATMERWRWTPHELGERHIRVNIPDYELVVVEDGRRLRDMDVIVGREKRPTPLFSSALTWTEFNPTWTVPRSIAEKDFLPELIADPGYVVAKNVRVYADWTNNAPTIDPYAVDWAALGRGIRYFMFRQAPGPNNALGKVKFMMSNNFSVYLHDTPDRHLFARSRRAYSSGCIRVADPMWLADFVLDGSPNWDGADEDPVMSHWRTKRINMPEAVPLHVVYATAWTDADDSMQFREDVYGLDAAVYAALEQADARETRLAAAE
ncbi:MAG: L,D-transpeptidase family protein [Azospirillaceae bacterium]